MEDKITEYLDLLPRNKRHLVCRAKSKDNGEWVYGFYYENDNESIISTFKPNTTTPFQIFRPVHIDVDTNTVCSCTGTKCWDNYIKAPHTNKKYIFEGDVIRTYHCNSILNIGIVKYADYEDMDLGTFILDRVYGCGDYEDGTLYDYIGEVGMEIIGNIYDNPEMASEEYYLSRQNEFDLDKKIK